MPFFFLMAISLNLWAQYDSITTVYEYVDDFDQISYRGGLGLFIPASNKNFRVATFIEFSMNISTNKVNSVELVVQFGGWARENNFTYTRRRDTQTATSKIFFNGLLKFKRDVLFFERSFIGVGAGLGISSVLINTDFFEQGIEDEIKPYKSMSSFMLSPELEYLLDITEKTQISISLGVQYVTYKLRVALENDIGKWYFLPKVSYRF